MLFEFERSFITLSAWPLVNACDCWKIVNNADKFIRFAFEWIVML